MNTRSANETAPLHYFLIVLRNGCIVHMYQLACLPLHSISLTLKKEEVYKLPTFAHSRMSVGLHSPLISCSSLLTGLLLPQDFVFTGGAGTECSDAGNQPSNNINAETYGAGSRCVKQGREWHKGNVFNTLYGSGCYQVYKCKGVPSTLSGLMENV